MNSSNSSHVSLEVALFFVQKLPLSYQKAIFDWLSKNENLQKVESNTINKEIEEERIPLKFGAGKHLITFVADDFDEPLEDFKEYM
jgi:hypothetical protein